MTNLRSRLVGTDGSLAERLRLRRWQRLAGEFPELARMHVLDLGGTTVWWTRAPIRPKSVTVINLLEPGDGLDWLTPIQGDACDAPELVAGRRFDLVFSNSLIEHLGGHAPRTRFADAVRALAPRYAVQTPYRYFPVEPHWLFPGMQFLPMATRGWLAPRWPLGHTYGWPPERARDEVMFTDLLSASEMRRYFPDARIEWERIAGVPKSMIAIR
ncbi:MAG: class I SAM-dependent methyltransferase [Actinobacteria bacterium]|nr:class I SAM-dependent methyltransferase [Actinomycetota bacterium]